MNSNEHFDESLHAKAAGLCDALHALQSLLSIVFAPVPYLSHEYRNELLCDTWISIANLGQ